MPTKKRRFTVESLSLWDIEEEFERASIKDIKALALEKSATPFIRRMAMTTLLMRGGPGTRALREITVASSIPEADRGFAMVLLGIKFLDKLA